MPHISIKTPTGKVKFHYNILTPKSPCAKHIDPDIPTIVFFHSLYLSQEIFEPQASDPKLRKFNLVLIDSRAHGQTEGRIGNPYTPTQTADDTYRIMLSLKLPPCHVFGLSIGACAAIELAINHPELVLSLTLCSPLPPEEPEIALSGRQEIFDCYNSALKNAPHSVDNELVDEAVYGTLQMIFNNTSSPTIDAITAVTLVHILRNWGWEKEKVADGEGVIGAWFASRKRLSVKELSRIQCPILLIHCDDDLAYPEEGARETEQDMIAAGLNVTFRTIAGPHFGCFTNPTPVNVMLHDMVVANSRQPGATLPASATYPIKTPFHDALASKGYYNHGGDSDEEEFA